MIFYLVPATETHGVILQTAEELHAEELYSMLETAFPNQQMMICCYGGYCNALEFL